MLAFLSQVFMYSFIIFFMYSVLSILVTILTESYETVRTDLRKEKKKRKRIERTLRLATLALMANQSSVLPLTREEVDEKSAGAESEPKSERDRCVAGAAPS